MKLKQNCLIGIAVKVLFVFTITAKYREFNIFELPLYLLYFDRQTHENDVSKTNDC